MTKNNGTSATLDTVADELNEEQASGVSPVEDYIESLGLDQDTDRHERCNAEYKALCAKLDQPLDRARIKKRRGFGDGKELSYLTHSDVTRTLNKIFGYGQWAAQVTEVKDFFDEGDGIPRAVRVTLNLSIQASNFDYGGMTTIGYSPVNKNRSGNYTWAAYEMAVGNAEAKAFKRAASKYGDQFGLSLYDGDDEADQVEDLHLEREAKSTSGGSKPDIVNGVAHCEDCNKDIKGYTNRTTGKTYTTEDLVTMSKKQAGGHILCLDCRQKRTSGD